MIDLNLIERGADYSELKKSYVIFICPFDAFGAGLHKYTFESICKELPQINLGDEATKIFLCASGDADDVSPDMKDFLDWLSGKQGKSRLVCELEEAVQRVKDHKEWRTEYMTLFMRDQEMMRKGAMSTLFSLVEDGDLTIDKAARRVNMKPEEFKEAMEKSKAVSV